MNDSTNYSTYDHRSENTDHPVRSGVLKLRIGRLVLRWVTTREYLLLYVFREREWNFAGEVWIAPSC
ncbi:hypothetical protein B0A54_07321 [Friedmanniomyces endolithicus]|uniref:Uncharacterized protein n=1 Tax=Friedmanniomyces endolithicus TaxID=329885 RepID=A0A4U0V1J5_9PEZI|nr:hypothetical protein B0A54_07321 [Friedmanniomyces endolithicus]